MLLAAWQPSLVTRKDSDAAVSRLASDHITNQYQYQYTTEQSFEGIKALNLTTLTWSSGPELPYYNAVHCEGDMYLFVGGGVGNDDQIQTLYLYMVSKKMRLAFYLIVKATKPS